MKGQTGYFDRESLRKFESEYLNKMDFSEDQDSFDFARCQRPDGSVYGTSGQCRKGTEVGAKKAEPKTKKSPKSKEKTAKENTNLKSPTATNSSSTKPEVKPEKTKSVVGEVKKAKGSSPPEKGGKSETKKSEKPSSPKKEEKPKEATQPSARKILEDEVARLEKAYKADQSSFTKGDLDRAQRNLRDHITHEAMMDRLRKLKEIDRRQEEAMKSMSETDLKAITDYTKAHNPLNVFGRGRSYKNLNSCVRKKEGCKDKKQNQHAEELDAALNKMPKNQDQVPFYRGVPVGKNTQALYDMLKNAQPGTTLKDPGYGSYSSNDGIAKSFGENKKGEKSILFVNRSQEIRPINKASAIKEENEGILPRGMTSIIRRVTEDEQGNLVVELD